MINKDYIYIYNIFQANFLIQNSCPIVETGYGKLKDVYWKFLKNERTCEALGRWKERKTN